MSLFDVRRHQPGQGQQQHSNFAVYQLGGIGGAPICIQCFTDALSSDGVLTSRKCFMLRWAARSGRWPMLRALHHAEKR